MDKKIYDTVLQELKRIPVVDAHCHINSEKPQAQSIGDILFYHFLKCEIYSAGGDDTFLISNASLEEKMDYFLKYLPVIENTTTWWCVKKILKDLYDLKEPLNHKNWQNIQKEIEKNRNDTTWPENLLTKKLKIEHSLCCCDWYSKNLAEEKSMEKPYLSLHPEGVCFGPLFGKGILDFLSHEKKAETLKETTDLIQAMLKKMLETGFKSFGIAFDYLFQPVSFSGEKLNQVYQKYLTGESLSYEELNALSTHFLYKFLETIKGKATVQVVIGALWNFGGVKWDFHGGESYVVVSNNLIPGLIQVFKDFQDIRFNIYYCSETISQQVTIIARMLPNVSLLGFWWHNLFPGYIKKMIAERIEALPSNKWILIGTDAYSCEWSYGKFSLVLDCLAEVLAEKIEEGYLSLEKALYLARRILYENPKSIYGLNSSE